MAYPGDTSRFGDAELANLGRSQPAGLFQQAAKQSMAHLVGVLLAAGRGSRMGRTKQLLPWPPGEGSEQVPLVAAAFDAVALVCDAMIVVVGHDAPAVIEALGARSFTTVESSADVDMYESVRRGLHAASAAGVEEHFHVLLHCADHPEVAMRTLVTLRDAAGADPHRVVLPVYGDRGGHPVLVPSQLLAALIGYSGRGGLRQYWIDHPEVIQRIAVDDPGVVQGINRPEDYRS